MKKILYSLFSLLLLITSCNLEKKPSGTVGIDEPLTVKNLSYFRTSLYLRLRGLSAGGVVYIGELSSDLFHATAGYGNRNGDTYRWTWTTTNSAAESLWSSCYSTNADANFFIKRIAEVRNANPQMSSSDSLALELYKGEAHFLKALSMYELAIRYCKVYSADEATVDDGVLIYNEFVEPSPEVATYRGRSSLADTYNYIDTNLVIAYDIINSIAKLESGKSEESALVKNKVASKYLTPHAIKAMQARVALAKGDYEKAAQLSEELVNENVYPLVSGKEAFLSLWKQDSGEECLMQLDANYIAESLPASNDPGYVGDQASGIYSPDFVPESWVIDLFPDNDIRGYWFMKKRLTYGNITGSAYLLNKFPGNFSLQNPRQATSDHRHKVKLFRIAEQYLIAAESYAMLGKNDLALKYYKGLREKRDNSFVAGTLSNEALIKAIREERVRELIGEGFRFFDLKRYKKGFSRGECQNRKITNNPDDAMSSLLSISPNHHGFLWPIPKTEIDVNPQIRNQQNPGYNE